MLQWAGVGLAGTAMPALGASPLSTQAAVPAVMKVGRNQAVKSLAEASQRARDGMVIEVDAGDYAADVASWPQSDLTLKAVGGRVRLLAMGAAAQGKGIFVTSGERLRIQGFDFIGARVPDRNGAGIRLERGSLSVRDCSFKNNENGILTSNDPATRLELEDCEFDTIVRHGGQNHNLYVGAIAHLRVIGCYFHHGQIGHLLKSRAAVNQILYNRLSDEIGGESSYELEFPNGGQALVLGNLIQQSSGTQNPHLISFGAEGLTWPKQELQLIHNTLVDQRPSGGIFLRVSPGPVKVRIFNNLLVGNPRFVTDKAWEQGGNFITDLDEFVLAARENYALRPNSSLRGKAVDPGDGFGQSLRPTRQYQHPRSTVALTQIARHPGAFQIP
ncbi:MAG: right-handed parallel beta-helix repeat-containing protein [Paucibacter sp.]|nr:right-handed parallel beta-helix repeat-containing protein [Roseateles sp.]